MKRTVARGPMVMGSRLLRTLCSVAVMMLLVSLSLPGPTAAAAVAAEDAAEQKALAQLLSRGAAETQGAIADDVDDDADDGTESGIDNGVDNGNEEEVDDGTENDDSADAEISLSVDRMFGKYGRPRRRNYTPEPGAMGRRKKKARRSSRKKISRSRRSRRGRSRRNGRKKVNRRRSRRNGRKKVNRRKSRKPRRKLSRRGKFGHPGKYRKRKAAFKRKRKGRRHSSRKMRKNRRRGHARRRKTVRRRKPVRKARKPLRRRSRKRGYFRYHLSAQKNKKPHHKINLEPRKRGLDKHPYNPEPTSYGLLGRSLLKPHRQFQPNYYNTIQLMKKRKKIQEQIKLANLQAKLYKKWKKIEMNGMKDPLPLPTERIPRPAYLMDAKKSGLENMGKGLGLGGATTSAVFLPPERKLPRGRFAQTFEELAKMPPSRQDYIRGMLPDGTIPATNTPI